MAKSLQTKGIRFKCKLCNSVFTSKAGIWTFDAPSSRHAVTFAVSHFGDRLELPIISRRCMPKRCSLSRLLAVSRSPEFAQHHAFTVYPVCFRSVMKHGNGAKHVGP